MTVVHWPAERWLRWPHLGDRHGRALLALAFYVIFKGRLDGLLTRIHRSGGTWPR